MFCRPTSRHELVPYWRSCLILRTAHGQQRRWTQFRRHSAVSYCSTPDRFSPAARSRSMMMLVSPSNTHQDHWTCTRDRLTSECADRPRKRLQFHLDSVFYKRVVIVVFMIAFINKYRKLTTNMRIFIKQGDMQLQTRTPLPVVRN